MAAQRQGSRMAAKPSRVARAEERKGFVLQRRSSLLPLALVVLALHSARASYIRGEADSFPGWLGPNHDSEGSRKVVSPRYDSSRVIQLSAHNPRAYLYKGFLSHEECDHIIATAVTKLERSKVTGKSNGNGEVSGVRTSSGSFIAKGTNPVVTSIEKRIEEWTFLPTPNQEPLQVLRYQEGQKYVPHVDYFPDDPSKQLGGQQYATVLMYLSNVTLGGETVFTNVKDDTPKDDSWSECAKGFLAVKPKKGDALLFFSMHPDGSPDPASMHYACPVVKGIKWSAPKWIHVREYDNPIFDPSICENANYQCDFWATAGECQKNPKYMLNACRKACNNCQPKANNSS